jgi:hypothetical protein
MCTFDIWDFIKSVLTFPPFAGLFGAALGLLFLQYLRAWWVGSRISVTPIEHHGQFSNIRVYNGSPFSMRDTYVYITIKHKKGDIQNSNSYIQPLAATHVYEDRISWCLNSDGKITAKADTHPFERQAATLVHFANTGDLTFASENGVGPGRVSLLRKSYDMLIKVVAADTRQAAWFAKIDPSNEQNPITILQKLSINQYESKLKEFQKYYYLPVLSKEKIRINLKMS